jgi:hypothetical protein
MKILNSKEAFEAMMAGRNIMCRAAGELMDFDDLSQFPATIFGPTAISTCSVLTIACEILRTPGGTDDLQN